VDLGALRPGEERALDLPWRREGAGSLRLLGVRTDCGCSSAQAPPGPLAAGSRGALAVRVRAPGRPGPFSTRVRWYTDAPGPYDRHETLLRGWVDAPVVARPAALDLGRRSAGGSLERTIEVAWEPGSRPPGLAACRVALAGVTGRARIDPPARGGEEGCLLRLSLRVPAAAGPFAGQAALHCGARCLVAVPLRGTAVGPPPPEGGLRTGSR
jgi:hypothetical protein